MIHSNWKKACAPHLPLSCEVSLKSHTFSRDTWFPPNCPILYPNLNIYLKRPPTYTEEFRPQNHIPKRALHSLAHFPPNTLDVSLLLISDTSQEQSVSLVCAYKSLLRLSPSRGALTLLVDYGISAKLEGTLTGHLFSASTLISLSFDSFYTSITVSSSHTAYLSLGNTILWIKPH